jgi:tetratricopeptide (TPR) repeat protein
MICKELESYYYNKGIDLFENNRITEAIQVFNSAAVIDNNIEILNLLGLCYYRLGEFEKSLCYWHKSIEINSTDDNYANAYIKDLISKEFSDVCEKFNKSLLLCKENKYKQALKILSNLPVYEFVKVANVYGLCNFAVRKKEKALYIWKQALKVDVDNEETLNYIKQDWDSVPYREGIFKKFGEALSKLFT